MAAVFAAKISGGTAQGGRRAVSLAAVNGPRKW